MGDVIRVEVSFDTNTPLGAALAGMRPRFRSGLVRTVADIGFRSDAAGHAALANNAATLTAGARDPRPAPRPTKAAVRVAPGRGKASKVVGQPHQTKSGASPGNTARRRREIES